MVNEDRLHGHCQDVPPAEYEAAVYAAQESNPDAGVGIQICRASIRPRCGSTEPISSRCPVDSRPTLAPDVGCLMYRSLRGAVAA